MASVPCAPTLRERVVPGERVVVRGRLEPFDEPRNPGEPSMREIERDDGFVGRLASAHLLARAPPDPLDVRAWAARLRAAAAQRIRAVIPGTVGDDSCRRAVGRARHVARRSARCVSGHRHRARAGHRRSAPRNRGGTGRVFAVPAWITSRCRVRGRAGADRALTPGLPARTCPRSGRQR